MKDLNIKHLSYSSVAMWYRCPREWWLKYKYNITPPSTSPLAFGTAMHRTIQQGLLKGGINNGDADLFGEWLKSAANEAGIRMFMKEFDELKRTGENIILDPTIQHVVNSIKVSSPEQIEMKIEFEVPGVPLPVLGYIDIIDDEGHPYDIKTSKYDWDEGRADAEIQPDFYLTALDILGDHRHKGSFSHLIIVKNADAPSAYMMDTQREDYRERVFTYVQEMWRGVESEEWQEKVVREACVNCKLKVPCYYNK